MQRVFADTGYWVGLLNPRDVLHQKALALSREFDLSQIVTSEMVLTELLNSCSSSGVHLRQAAALTVESLRGSSKARIVPQTTELFGRALQLYQAMLDKSWGLTDCATIIIMKDEGLTTALTHDRHFIQAGFEARLR